MALTPTMIAEELKELGPTLFRMFHTVLQKKEDETVTLRRVGSVAAQVLHLCNQRLSVYALKLGLFLKASGNSAFQS